MCSISRIESVSCYCVRSRYGAPSDRPFADVRTAAARGFDRLDALCRGRRQPVKGLGRLRIGARLNARQSPLTGCRRPQDCIQAIKAVSNAADRAFLTQHGEAAIGARLNAREIALAWPPPARVHPSDQGPRQGRAPLRLLHPLKIQKSFPPGLARPAAHETSATRGAVPPGKFLRAAIPPSPLPAEKRLERRLRLVRPEPSPENLRLLVDPPHDFSGGAADQAARSGYGFGGQRRDLAGGLQGFGLDFAGRDNLVDEAKDLGLVG